MPYRSFNDPTHWQERAEEARAHAQQMTDPEAKRMMLAIAEDYEKLARRAQERRAWEQRSGQPT
jgi:ribosome-binding protein aMBF1 (putative translation factor)